MCGGAQDSLQHSPDTLPELQAAISPNLSATDCEQILGTRVLYIPVLVLEYSLWF